jgi:hypothetical protein
MIVARSILVFVTRNPCTFPTAHFIIYDIPVIAVLAEDAFDTEPPTERHRVYAAAKAELQRTHPAAEVVLIWRDVAGRTRFIAPVQQHRFFEVVKYDQLRAQVDGSITLTRA